MRGFLALALLLATSAALAQEGNTPGLHFERASAAFEQRLYAAAAREYELAYQSGGHPALFFNIGESYRLAGDPAKAMAAYRNYVERVPDGARRNEALQRIAELAAIAPPPPPPAAPPAPYYAPAPYAPPPYAPPPYAPPPYAPAPYAPALPTELPGWSLGAGVYGVIAATAVLGLTIGSELTKSESVPSLPLGLTATVLHVVSVPIVAAGSASVRSPMHVRGSLGLRITGWIAYGLTTLDAIALLTLGGLGVEPPTGLISSVGALGFLSGLSMAIDAFVSRNQAEARLPRSTTALQPALSIPADGRGGILGLSGRF